MDVEEKYGYWLDAAEYDLASAQAMFDAGQYAYVAFMCQQSLEKIAKGLYNYYIDDNVPRVHNINFILGKVLDVLGESGDKERLYLFDRLAAYYLQGRYPSFKEKVSLLLSKDQAKELLNESREAFIWLRSLKK